MPENEIVRNRRPPVVGSRKPQNKVLIRHAAARLFEVRGYQGTTVDDIASATRLNKATIYHYYASKREILFDICDSSLDAVLEKFASHDLTRNPKLLLSQVITDVIATTAEDRSRTAVYYQERHFWRETLGPEPYVELRSKERDCFDHVRRIVETAIADGGLAPVDPEAATFLVMTVAGQTYLWFRADDSRNADEVGAVVSRLVLRGLQRR